MLVRAPTAHVVRRVGPGSAGGRRVTVALVTAGLTSEEIVLTTGTRLTTSTASGVGWPPAGHIRRVVVEPLPPAAPAMRSVMDWRLPARPLRKPRPASRRTTAGSQILHGRARLAGDHEGPRIKARYGDRTTARINKGVSHAPASAARIIPPSRAAARLPSVIGMLPRMSGGIT